MKPTLMLLFGCLAMVGLARAQSGSDTTEYQVPLVAGKPYLHVLHEGRSVKVERVQDPEFELRGYYAKTSRKCPPFRLHPMAAALDVQTVGEVEIFDFMETKLRDGTGMLIDSRTEDWYRKGTIPGAVHVAFDSLATDADDPKWAAMLGQFGVRSRGPESLMDQATSALGLAGDPLITDKWDFTRAKDLILFCNGHACDQSPRAIRSLLDVGYPASKLFYYRGGMQEWET
jgi:rhodanese-related sulfurtransferase